jgi:hypothetical protein
LRCENVLSQGAGNATRYFIQGLAGSAIVWSLAAHAQSGTGRIRRIGIIDDSPSWDPFRQQLRELHYVEGQNLAYVYLRTDGRIGLEIPAMVIARRRGEQMRRRKLITLVGGAAETWPRIAALGLLLAAMSLAVPTNATTPVPAKSRLIVLAQAMIPRTGMMDAQNPMPMKERYLKRFPQPTRVGNLIGMPVLDLYSKTLGYVRKVVRTATGEIEFIVDYSQWWGWFGRPVAVPLEAIGIEGGHLVSLDMSPSEYAAAPTWHDTGAISLPADATVRVALSRS